MNNLNRNPKIIAFVTFGDIEKYNIKILTMKKTDYKVNDQLRKLY